MQERKFIPWFEWLYIASTWWIIKCCARQVYSKWIFVYNKKEKEIGSTTKKWYKRVALMKNGKRYSLFVHRVIAKTFLDNDIIFTWKNLVCHKDDNKQNNHIDNLFIWTYQDNNIDCVNKWRWVNNKWERHGMSRLSDIQIQEIRNLLKYWYKQTVISSMFSTHPSHISRISRNLSRKI